MAGGSPGPCVSGLAFVAYCNQLAFIYIRKWLILNGLHLFSSFLDFFLVLLAARWQCRLSCTTQRPNHKPTKTMKPELKTITPALAKKMLEKNIGNRALTAWHVDRLAKEMKGGRWKVNGDMIRIGENGRVLDGQHRLHAVVKSGITIQSWVMEGMSDDIFDSIDQLQKIRSGGDTLGCSGEKNAYRLASALILVDKYMTGRVEKSIQYSNGEMEELLEKYPEVRHSVQTTVKGKKLILPSVMDACHYLFSRKDAELANHFLERVLRGSGLEEGDPEYVLREKLVFNSLAKAKLSKAHVFALCIKAWNHARAGKKITHLKLNEKAGKLIEFPVVQ